MTRGAGLTEVGVPYEARFPDKHGNLCICYVSRTDCISTYFKYFNTFNLHNQVQQFDLVLEKKWVTKGPYFYLCTTEVGMAMVDYWKIYKSRHKIGGSAPSVNQFVNILALDMIEYVNTLIEDLIEIKEQPSSDILSVTYTSVSVVNSIHTQVLLSSKNKIRCIWCSRVNLVEQKSTIKCLEYRKGFYRTTTCIECWSDHVVMGYVPKFPVKGTKRV